MDINTLVLVLSVWVIPVALLIYALRRDDGEVLAWALFFGLLALLFTIGVVAMIMGVGSA